MMKAGTDSDVFLSKLNQMRDKLRDLDEVVSAEHLTTIILEALLAESSTIKLQAVRDPGLSFINHSERLSGTKNNQQSNPRGWKMVESQRRPLS